MCDGGGEVVLGTVPLGNNLIEGLIEEEGTEDGIKIYQEW
jgi:hypothetical protein